MSKLVFRLNNVPETEADLVRELLTEHDFEFYETHAGRWGISVAALWLKNDEDFAAARALIDEFQQQHTLTMRAEYDEAKKEGRIPTFWQLLRGSPVAFISYWVLILAVAALSIFPIFGFFDTP
jgi:hypothetical protein